MFVPPMGWLLSAGGFPPSAFAEPLSLATTMIACVLLFALALALLVVIVAVVVWLGLRTFVRSLRARKAETTTGGRFPDYALEALANAARMAQGNPELMQLRALQAMQASDGRHTVVFDFSGKGKPTPATDVDPLDDIDNVL